MRQNETRYSCDDLNGCRPDMPMTGDRRVHMTMLPSPIRKADEREREERAQDKRPVIHLEGENTCGSSK